jgi:hypothetical protein
MCDSIKEMRREQTLRELDRLCAELECWRARRVDDDTDPNGQYRGQYETQLSAIVDEVKGAAGILGTEIQKVSLAQDIGNVYAACETNDRRIVWLWRAWEFFRRKFDQRDDPALRAVLRAAEPHWGAGCRLPWLRRPTGGRRSASGDRHVWRGRRCRMPVLRALVL